MEFTKPIEIPAHLHAQVTDKSNIDKVNFKLFAAPITENSSLKKLPVNFPAELTKEETNDCWSQAYDLSESGDKYDVQRIAINLIQTKSQQKAEAARREASRVSTRRTHEVAATPSTAVPSMKKSSRSSSQRTQPAPNFAPRAKSKKVKVVKRAAQAKQSTRRSRIIEPPAPEVADDDGFMGEVVVEYGGISRSVMASRVLDSPTYVVVAVDEEYDEEDILHLPNAALGAAASLTVNWLDADGGTTFRKVLAHPVRFYDKDTMYIVFHCFRDGALDG